MNWLAVFLLCGLFSFQLNADVAPLSERKKQWAEFDRVREKCQDHVIFLIPRKAAEGLPVKYLTPATDLFPKNHLKWGYNYMSHEKMNKEEALKVVDELQSRLIRDLEKNKDDVIYFYSGIVKEKIDPKEIGVKITFWDDEYDRMKPPFVAEAGTFDGVYYTRDADEKGEELLGVELVEN